MPPTNWCKDCVVARRCKLFLGAELERCAMVLEDPFLWPTSARQAVNGGCLLIRGAGQFCLSQETNRAGANDASTAN